MRLARRLPFLALVLALLAPAALAQTIVNIPMAMRYDLDAVSAGTPLDGTIFCRMTGPFTGSGLIETSGSSATVTAVAAAQVPFTNMVAGDVLVVQPATAGAKEIRALTAVASAISVTVDTAIDWSRTVEFVWYHHVCGTGATDGWVSVGDYTEKLVGWHGAVLSGDTNNVDVVWDCLQDTPGMGLLQVYPDNSAAIDTTGVVETMYEAAAGRNATRAVRIPDACTFLRLGMAWNTADDGADTGADREIINVTFSGIPTPK